ncbi:asparaginase [Escherichia coli]|uniref:asparaginase n=1 Tax=Escherichia coli TaxID=562 RepID=UPI00136560BB|nr:asparaginase [Escherichia coli]MWT74201.1 hypothetical protein [Escherichia coli]
MKSESRPVLFLATGGTIAGKTPEGKSGTYESGSLGISTLLGSSDTLRNKSEYDAEDISAVGSQDMSEEIWLHLHTRIRQAFSDGYKVVIVTHGTDTLEETAFMLDLTLPPEGTVILAGAMRPADSPGADGPRIIQNALEIARKCITVPRGVIALSGDTIFNSRTVYKAVTSGTEGMRAWPGGPCGYVSPAGAHFFPAGVYEHYAGFFTLPSPGHWPRVPVLFVTACMDSFSADAVLRTHPAGVVVAGVGHGNVPEWLLAKLTDFVSTGGVVVRSTRINEGAVKRNLEVDDENRGFISAGFLSPQRSRILLQLILSQNTSTLSEIQHVFDAVNL